MSSTRIVSDSAQWVRATILVVLLVSGAACGSPSAPSDPYVGTWSGVIEDGVAGGGSLQFTLSDTANLAGSWRATVSGTSLTGSISLLPAVEGSARQLGLTCGSAPSGGAVLFTPSLNGTTLQGSYLAFGCGNLTRGMARLTRR